MFPVPSVCPVTDLIHTPGSQCSCCPAHLCHHTPFHTLSQDSYCKHPDTECKGFVFACGACCGGGMSASLWQPSAGESWRVKTAASCSSDGTAHGHVYSVSQSSSRPSVLSCSQRWSAQQYIFYIFRKTCFTRIHPSVIAVLFITATTWEQPKCPSAEEWVNKTW